MASNRFYLACLRDNVGSNVAFHAKEGRGYTTDLDQAEVYTREGVQRAWNSLREFEQPLCAEQVDILAIEKVDCQYIPSKNTLSEAGDHRYVAYKKGQWDGNDVYWLRQEGRGSELDFSEAGVFPKINTYDGLTWIPLAVAEKAKRRTFDASKINERKMTQGAGVKVPDHVKRYRRRKGNSGKIRMNCPTCGCIAWQYSPYEFDRCNNIKCADFRF